MPLFLFILPFFTTFILKHIFTIHSSISIRRGLSQFFLIASVHIGQNLHGVLSRLNLGLPYKLQQASALPMSYAAPMSYATPKWAPLHPLFFCTCPRKDCTLSCSAIYDSLYFTEPTLPRLNCGQVDIVSGLTAPTAFTGERSLLILRDLLINVPIMRILKLQNHTAHNNYSPNFALHGRILQGDLKRALHCLAFLTWGMV